MSVIANEQYVSGAGVIAINAPTNATFTGAWIKVGETDVIAFQAQVGAGHANPTSAWGVDVTDDEDPARPVLGPTPLTMSATFTGQNPAGAGAAINFLFQFGPNAPMPMPCCKWMRFNLVRTSGGDGTGLNIALHKKGVL